jgi:hypothetical protein
MNDNRRQLYLTTSGNFYNSSTKRYYRVSKLSVRTIMITCNSSILVVFFKYPNALSILFFDIHRYQFRIFRYLKSFCLQLERISRKLFIGSLPFNNSESELSKLCRPFGDVVSVKLVIDQFTGKSKGLCFVEMPN